MNDRLRFFKWRAIARRMAESAPPGSAEQIAAIQFRDGIDSAMLTNRADDRSMRLKGIERGVVYHALLVTSSEPIYLRERPLSLVERIDPANEPQAEGRIAALVNLFNALSAGVMIVTPAVQRAFRAAAFRDPDPQVRAWALFLIDPENHPRPTDAEKGE